MHFRRTNKNAEVKFSNVWNRRNLAASNITQKNSMIVSSLTRNPALQKIPAAVAYLESVVVKLALNKAFTALENPNLKDRLSIAFRNQSQMVDAVWTGRIGAASPEN
jgi:hypothetical protein